MESLIYLWFSLSDDASFTAILATAIVNIEIYRGKKNKNKKNGEPASEAARKKGVKIVLNFFISILLNVGFLRSFFFHPFTWPLSFGGCVCMYCFMLGRTWLMGLCTEIS